MIVEPHDMVSISVSYIATRLEKFGYQNQFMTLHLYCTMTQITTITYLTADH